MKKNKLIITLLFVVIFSLNSCYKGISIFEHSSYWQPFMFKKKNRIKMLKELSKEDIDSIQIELFIPKNIKRRKSDSLESDSLIVKSYVDDYIHKYIQSVEVEKKSNKIQIILTKTELNIIANHYETYIKNSLMLLQNNLDKGFPTTGRTTYTNNLDSNYFNYRNNKYYYYGEVAFYTNKLIWFSQFYNNELYFDSFYLNESAYSYEYQALTFPRVAADRFTNEFINAILQYQKQKLSITDTNSIYDQWYKYSN